VKSKLSPNSFKLSNASQQYIKQKTYTAKKNLFRKNKAKKDRQQIIKKVFVPGRYVLEKNPFMLGKRRPMNEKNFYAYLNGIPSLGKEKENLEDNMDILSKRKIKKDYKDLGQLEKDNLQLNEDLKDLNEKLSQMIGKKGYENLLEELKVNKKVFMERPVSRQVKILKGELRNGEKTISILKKEKARVEKMLEKVVSPVSLSDIMQKINNKRKEIKELKSQNFGLVMENKKVGKMLEKGELGDQGILKKLLMQYNTVRSKNNDIELEIERLENVKKELIEKKSLISTKDEEVQKKLVEVGLGKWDPEIEKMFLKTKKILEKEEHRKKIMEKNFKVKETEIIRMKGKKRKGIEKMKEELEQKKELLRKLQKEEMEVNKEREKIEEELRQEKEKGEGNSNDDRIRNNLKKFQTQNGKAKKKEILDNKETKLFSTKTDQEETLEDMEEKEKEKDPKEESIKDDLEKEASDSEEMDEVEKLLKNKPKEDEREKTNDSKEENFVKNDINEIEGQKTPTLNGSMKTSPRDPMVIENKSKNVLTEKNENVNDNTAPKRNHYDSFAIVETEKNNDKENEDKDDIDDFDKLLDKGEGEEKEEVGDKGEKQVIDYNKDDDDDFDFMD
jgi:hypothetical protein